MIAKSYDIDLQQEFITRGISRGANEGYEHQKPDSIEKNNSIDGKENISTLQFALPNN